MLKFSNPVKKNEFSCSQHILRFSDQGDKMQFLWSPFINIDSRELGSEAINKIIKEIEKFKKIKILLLPENEIDDSSIDVIINLISNPEISLEILDLGGNNITEAGAKKLFAAAQERESLCELFLRGNPKISMVCIKEIEEFMAQRKQKSLKAKPLKAKRRKIK